VPFAVTDPALTHDLGPIQFIFLMLAYAIGLTYLARRLRIADPILLLLGGIVLSQLPDLPDLRASFFLIGPSVPAGRSLGLIDMRDIATTLARRLNLTLPTDGKVLLP